MDRRERFAPAQALDAPAILPVCPAELIADADRCVVKRHDPFETNPRRPLIVNQYFHQPPLEPSPQTGQTAQREREQAESGESERRHRRARNFEKHAFDFDPVRFDADLPSVILILSGDQAPIVQSPDVSAIAIDQLAPRAVEDFNYSAFRHSDMRVETVAAHARQPRLWKPDELRLA